jgi:hypothetical protein
LLLLVLRPSFPDFLCPAAAAAAATGKRKPDITLAQTKLGWNPTVALEEGLKLTVADFRARYEAGELLAKPPAAAAAADAAAAAGAGAAKTKK